MYFNLSQAISKMIIKAKSYIILVSLLFIGCDPAKILIIKTSGAPNVYVTVYANKSILPENRENLEEKIVIHFPTSSYPPKNDTAFFYGLGNWPKQFIPNFAVNIDSIIISNSSDKIILTNKDDINKYLIKKRSGYAKSKLTIEAK